MTRVITPAARAMALLTAAVCALGLVTAMLAPSASAAFKPATKATVKASARSKDVKTTVTITAKARKTGKTKKVKVTVNPYGSVKTGGKTVSKIVKLKWSKGSYRGKVSLATKTSGVVQVKAKGIKTVKVKSKKVSPKKVTTVPVKKPVPPAKPKPPVTPSGTYRTELGGWVINNRECSQYLLQSIWLRDAGPLDDCENTPAVSDVVGRSTFDPRCAVTIRCERAATQEEIGFQQSSFPELPPRLTAWWSPPSVIMPAVNASTKAETFYIPDFIAKLNAYAVRTEPKYKLDKPAYVGISSDTPFKPLWTSEFGGPIMSTQVTWPNKSSGLIKVPGQGGFAQHWAERLASGPIYDGTFTLRTGARTSTGAYSLGMGGHSCTGQAYNCVDFKRPAGATIDNDAVKYNTVNYPIPAGYRWSCGEQIWPIDVSENWDTFTLDAAHRAGVMNYAAASGQVYVNFGAVRWPNGQGELVIEMCGLVNTTGGPAGRLPGDTP